MNGLSTQTYSLSVSGCFCRDGEQSRQHLVRCSERYLRSHPVDGFTGATFTAEELAQAENGGHTNSEKALYKKVTPVHSRASDEVSLAEVDLEMGVSEWRKKGVPVAETKDKRWGAPYHVQFRILFVRWAPLELNPLAQVNGSDSLKPLAQIIRFGGL